MDIKDYSTLPPRLRRCGRDTSPHSGGRNVFVLLRFINHLRLLVQYILPDEAETEQEFFGFLNI